MTGAEFKAIRKRLGLSRAAFGLVLGYAGRPQNINSLIGQIERGDKPVTPWIGRLAVMYDRHGIPKEWRVDEIDWSKQD